MKKLTGDVDTRLRDLLARQLHVSRQLFHLRGGGFVSEGWGRERARERERERDMTSYEVSRVAQRGVAGVGGACSLPEVEGGVRSQLHVARQRFHLRGATHQDK